MVPAPGQTPPGRLGGGGEYAPLIILPLVLCIAEEESENTYLGPPTSSSDGPSCCFSFLCRTFASLASIMAFRRSCSF